MRRELGADTRPGIVVAIATAGDLLQWNVQLHVLASDGAFSREGTFHPLATWNAETLLRLFRERALARLVDRHAISEELAKRLSRTQAGIAPTSTPTLPIACAAIGPPSNRESPHRVPA